MKDSWTEVGVVFIAPEIVRCTSNWLLVRVEFPLRFGRVNEELLAEFCFSFVKFAALEAVPGHNSIPIYPAVKLITIRAIDY